MVFTASAISISGSFSLRLLAEVSSQPLYKVSKIIESLATIAGVFVNHATSQFGMSHQAFPSEDRTTPTGARSVELDAPAHTNGYFQHQHAHDIWLFVHDQYQSAAIQLIPSAERGTVHKAIADRLGTAHGANLLQRID